MYQLPNFPQVSTQPEAHKASCDAELQRRLEELARRREEARAELQKINVRMAKMTNDLNEHNADIHSDIADLMAKIHALNEKVRAKIAENAKDHIPDDLDAEFANEQDFGEEHIEIVFEQEKVPENKELVKLFRKIAKSTHPDKTDDPALHSMFVTAKEFRKHGDLVGMRDLWECLCGRASNLLNRLLQEIENERQALALLQMQLSQFLNSPDCALLSRYERDKMSVYVAIRQQAESRKMQLAAQLRMLQQMTGEYVPPAFVNFNFA